MYKVQVQVGCLHYARCNVRFSDSVWGYHRQEASMDSQRGSTLLSRVPSPVFTYALPTACPVLTYSTLLPDESRGYVPTGPVEATDLVSCPALRNHTEAAAWLVQSVRSLW